MNLEATNSSVLEQVVEFERSKSNISSLDNNKTLEALLKDNFKVLEEGNKKGSTQALPSNIIIKQSGLHSSLFETLCVFLNNQFVDNFQDVTIHNRRKVIHR